MTTIMTPIGDVEGWEISPMMRYLHHIARGDEQRMRHNRPDAAISEYERALAIGGERDTEIRQMIGVCYKMMHDYPSALHWYRRALRTAVESCQGGNILRDMAEATSRMGRHDEAMRLLDEALALLPKDTDPDAHAITLAFRGRVRWRMDDFHGAYLDTWAAVGRLRQPGANHHYQLYTELDLAEQASCLGELDHWLISKESASRAFGLAWRYGSRVHRIRALALLFGGHRLVDWLRQQHPRFA